MMMRLISSALILALIFILQPNVHASVLKQGDHGEQVVQLQNLLIARGLLTGSADGIYGEKTVAAIKKFQAEVGLTADGVCGDQTFAMLNADQTGAYAIKLGSRGDDVAEVQNILIAMGFMSGNADGVAGERTVEAIKSFQTSVGLTADGVAGERTLDSLAEAARNFEQSNGIYSAPTVETVEPINPIDLLEPSQEIPYETPSVEVIEPPMETPTVDPKLNSSGVYAEPGSVIRAGMYGEGVTEMQKKLIAHGFLNGAADGVCGAQTIEALKNFQASVGLQPDGVCGLMTYAALEDASYNTSDRTWDDVLDYERNYDSGYDRGRAIFVDATAYSAYDPGNGFYTARGSLVGHGIIAVDPSVIPLGTRVYIPGYGEAIADDVGGAIVGNRIDIAFDSHEEAIYFGRQYLEIYIIG